MTNSPNKKKYNADYAKKNFKRIPLDMQIYKYEQVKEAANAAGETVNGFIKTAIDMRIRHLSSLNTCQENTLEGLKDE